MDKNSTQLGGAGEARAMGALDPPGFGPLSPLHRPMTPGTTVSFFPAPENIPLETYKICQQYLPKGNGLCAKGVEDFFWCVDKPEKAYFIGFIAGDGCLIKDGMSVVINLKNGWDKHVLKALNEHCLRRPRRISEYHRVRAKRRWWGVEKTERDICVLKIRDRLLWMSMVRHGLTPCKSLTLHPPWLIPEEFWRDWIRGLWDADGCLCRNKLGKWVLSLATTEAVASWIKKLVAPFAVGHIYKRGKIVCLSFGAQEGVRRLADFMYANASHVCALPRKRVKYFRLAHEIRLPGEPEPIGPENPNKTGDEIQQECLDANWRANHPGESHA